MFQLGVENCLRVMGNYAPAISLLNKCRTGPARCNVARQHAIFPDAINSS